MAENKDDAARAADKWLHVGRFDYIIDGSTGQDIATIVTAVSDALTNQTVVRIPVLDMKRNRMTLFLNGARVDAVVIDEGLGPPRPGELYP